LLVCDGWWSLGIYLATVLESEFGALEARKGQIEDGGLQIRLTLRGAGDILIRMSHSVYSGN
jgi:hypothetical protein